MRWIYLSPHFDDIVLSVGGQVWEKAQAGQPVEIWTVCAGGPPPGAPLSPFAESLHRRWGTGPEATAIRRAEDEAAGRRLGAHLRYWDLPDCIYRRLPDGRWLVNGEEELWVALSPLEETTIERLRAWLAAELRPSDALVSPMMLGNHVDHQLVRQAAERAAAQVGCGLWFYADYPYAVRSPGELQSQLHPAWQKQCWHVSAGALAAWQAAVACHGSQISTFWGGLEEMRADIAAYWQAGGGACLWQSPDGDGHRGK